MKRYRVVLQDFDSRPYLLSLDIQDSWEESVKTHHRENQKRLIEALIGDFGSSGDDWKRQNFIDLGSKPISILAFHNQILEQIRVAFIMGAYYPALTATCALGERILNHLILLFREDFKETPEYKEVKNKGSFQNWSKAITTLVSWDILLPTVEEAFEILRKIRNQQAIHFDADTEQNARQLSLKAIGLLNRIVGEQFSAFGTQPWFIKGTPGECFIKKEAEDNPFIKKVYLHTPNCVYVGPFHHWEFDGSQFILQDDNNYEI